MIEPVKLPRLLAKELNSDGQTLKELARFHPIKLNPKLSLIPLSTVSMTIPESDPDVSMHDLIEVYTAKGSAGIFRVASIEKAPRKQRVIEMNHAMDILNDAMVVGTWDEEGNPEEYKGTVAAYFAKIMDFQSQGINGKPFWRLGTCADTTYWTRKLEYENLLELLCDVGKDHEDYCFTFDFSTFPWTLNFARRNSVVMSEFRLSRNVQDCRIELDDSDLCTRLYLSKTVTEEVTVDTGKTTEDGEAITEKAGDKTSQEYYTFDDTAAQATWGIVCKSAGIDAKEVPDTDAWVSDYFRRHNTPTVTITITGRELYKYTGVSIDEVHLGRICRVALPDYDTTFYERVVEVEYPDAINTPWMVNVSLANKRQTAEDSIAAVKKEAKKAGSGGGGAARQAANNATDLEFQKIRYNLRVEQDNKRWAIIASEEWWEQQDGKTGVMVGSYNSLFEVSARRLNSVFSVTGVVLGDDGFPITDSEGNYVFNGSNNNLYSQIVQSASAIRLEVGEQIGGLTTRLSSLEITAQGIESRVSTAEGNISTITQTAEGIEARVSTNEGNIGTLQLTANSFETRISTAEGNYSSISQRVDNIESRVETAEGNYSSISQRADSIEATVSNKLDKSSISMTANSITLNSQTISLQGYVQADYVDAVEAKIDNLTSGRTAANLILAATITSTGTLNCQTLNVGGALWSSHQITGIAGSNTVSFLGTNDGDLDHTHSIECSVSGGTVTVKVGKTKSGASDSDSFNIADTQYYKDGVAAATNAVTIDVLGYQADSGPSPSDTGSESTVITFPLHAEASNSATKDTSLTYSAGWLYRAGRNSVSQRTVDSIACSNVTQSNGFFTLALTATMSDETTSSHNVSTYVGVTHVSGNQYRVTLTSNGHSNSFTFNATEAYNAGWGAAASGSGRTGRTVTYPSSTVGSFTTETASITGHSYTASSYEQAKLVNNGTTYTTTQSGNNNGIAWKFTQASYTASSHTAGSITWS